MVVIQLSKLFLAKTIEIPLYSHALSKSCTYKIRFESKCKQENYGSTSYYPDSKVYAESDNPMLANQDDGSSRILLFYFEINENYSMIKELRREQAIIHNANGHKYLDYSVPRIKKNDNYKEVYDKYLEMKNYIINNKLSQHIGYLVYTFENDGSSY